jgi:glycosyltransferase involved in cell wall biosynthesis
VVAFLTDELVRLGHDVTLFASGGSRTLATLHAAWPESLRLGGTCRDPLAPHVLMLEEVARRATDFDVLHFHVSHLHLPLARRLPVAHVTTMHGRLDMPELAPLYDEFRDVPLISISDAQRGPLPRAGWAATIPHGLPHGLLSFRAGADGYLAFIGRISPEKRVDRAIAIATACRRRLRIAAKVDPADRDYFDREIHPLLANPFVDYIGEIDERRKADFLGGAEALLFPIDWPEPFGLVMIEALACGTPVIAFRGGSVPEVIEDGVTGFVVDSVEEACAAVDRIGTLDRRRCRQSFERRFTAARMARDHVAVYEAVIRRAGGRAHLPGVAS